MPKIYKHHSKNSFGKYGNVTNSLTKYPFIVEFVSNKNPTLTKVLDNIEVNISCRRYDSYNESYEFVPNVFFNKLIAYNSKQCTGEIELVINEYDSDYLLNQISDNNDSVIIDNKEDTWRISNFRDNVVLHDKPLFTKVWEFIKDQFPIDKIINPISYTEGKVIDTNKSWDEKELLRDKYTIIRLISDDDDDTVQLIFNYAIEQTNNSIR